jgi:hypothetical protein
VPVPASTETPQRTEFFSAINHPSHSLRTVSTIFAARQTPFEAISDIDGSSRPVPNRNLILSKLRRDGGTHTQHCCLFRLALQHAFRSLYRAFCRQAARLVPTFCVFPRSRAYSRTGYSRRLTPIVLRVQPARSTAVAPDCAVRVGRGGVREEDDQ